MNIYKAKKGSMNIYYILSYIYIMWNDGEKYIMCSVHCAALCMLFLLLYDYYYSIVERCGIIFVFTLSPYRTKHMHMYSICSARIVLKWWTEDTTTIIIIISTQKNKHTHTHLWPVSWKCAISILGKLWFVLLMKCGSSLRWSDMYYGRVYV